MTMPLRIPGSCSGRLQERQRRRDCECARMRREASGSGKANHSRYWLRVRAFKIVGESGGVALPILEMRVSRSIDVPDRWWLGLSPA
jgi:hypothetical protein